MQFTMSPQVQEAIKPSKVSTDKWTPNLNGGTARVLCGFPTTGMWSDQFGICLTQMVQETARRRPDIELCILSHKTSMLWAARQHFADSAVKYRYSHLLFIDTDQSFPSRLLDRLLLCDKAVVACNIATKSNPPQETATIGFNTKNMPISCEKNRGLEKVWRVGTGVMLIKTSVFLELQKPYFPIQWLPDQERYIGEDWGFCEKLEKAGIPIWVDHDASARVGHWGHGMYALQRYKEFQHEDTQIIGYDGEPMAIVGPDGEPIASAA